MKELLVFVLFFTILVIVGNGNTIDTTKGLMETMDSSAWTMEEETKEKIATQISTGFNNLFLKVNMMMMKQTKKKQEPPYNVD